MKKVYSLLFLSFLFLLSSKAQWYPQNVPSTANINCLYLFEDNILVGTTSGLY